jgi:segregation and condensation protein A
MLLETDTFTLSNFEGPLDLLWHLINRQEIDIYEIMISEITQQYLQRIKNIQDMDVDRGAEFIALAATLVLYKSKILLPKHEQQVDAPVDEEQDPRFEIIHQLIDYCRFKQAAKELTDRELQQHAFYSRGVEASEAKKNLGIAHLSLDDLAGMFREILSKASPHKGTIHEEEWRVGDKIKLFRSLFKAHSFVLFTDVFSIEQCREELIVTFLALLELMKIGEARVVLDPEKNQACIQAT